MDIEYIIRFNRNDSSNNIFGSNEFQNVPVPEFRGSEVPVHIFEKRYSRCTKSNIYWIHITL